MPSRKRVFQMAAATLVLVGGIAAAAIYLRPAPEKKPPARKPAPQARRPAKPTTNVQREKPATPVTANKEKRPSTVEKPPDAPTKRSPREVVEAACQLYFRGEVRLTAVSLDKGVLTLQGTITKRRQTQDAREVAVKALEEAGFGPIPPDKVVNLLRKPTKD